MTPEQAKEILARYRGNTRDETDPEIAEALQFALANPELNDWFREQQQFHTAMRAQFVAIEIPKNLKHRILAGKPPETKPPQPIWGWYEVATIAACLLVFLGGIVFVNTLPAHETVFEKFRGRMVSFALRTYQMDIVTSDSAAVREHIARQGGVADFEVTPELAKLPVKGGGRLMWQNRPVSMICFQLPNQETLYMFVIDQKLVTGSLPPTTPVLGIEKKLATVQWTSNGKAYLMAAAADSKTLAALAPASN